MFSRLFWQCLECCETIRLSSSNLFLSGLGIYEKYSVDSRDRMMYKNSDLVDFGYGSFILYYEGPNEDGTQEWVVCICQSKLINIEKI